MGTVRGRKIIAVLLGIWVAGSGHFFAGFHVRGLVFAGIFLGMLPLAEFGAFYFPGPLLFLPFLLLAVLTFWIIPRDAMRCVEKPDHVSRILPRLNWVIIPVWGFLFFTVLAPSVGGFPFEEDVRTFQWTSESMEPTLLTGDRILARNWPENSTGMAQPPQRGQLVVYDLRADFPLLISRVVAIGGDTISMRRGDLFINGSAIPEPYVAYPQTTGEPSEDYLWQLPYLPDTVDPEGYHPTPSEWGPLVVPENHFFWLGDYRAQSLDSRYWGFLPYEAIEAEPRRIYFSGTIFGGWGRIGRKFD